MFLPVSFISHKVDPASGHLGMIVPSRKLKDFFVFQTKWQKKKCMLRIVIVYVPDCMVNLIQCVCIFLLTSKGFPLLAFLHMLPHFYTFFIFYFLQCWGLKPGLFIFKIIALPLNYLPCLL